MIEIINKIILYIHYPFVRYAFITGILISLCAALLGVVLVLKRFSFIGDGLSHTAFGAMAVAAVVGVSNDMIIVLPITVLSAIFLLTGRKKINGDAAIAVISVSALALGYLLLNMFSASSNVSGDVCTTLFGATSILTLKKSEVLLCILMSFAVITIFVLFYNKIFAVTFDYDFAKVTGIPSESYNLMIAIVIAVVIVLAMKLVGSLLISALIVFPALGAMKLFKSFRLVCIFAGVFAVICALIGIIFAIVVSAPVGASIAVTNLVGYVICCTVGKVKN